MIQYLLSKYDFHVCVSLHTCVQGHCCPIRPHIDGRMGPGSCLGVAGGTTAVNPRWVACV